MQTFSERHGFCAQHVEISIRFEAPDALRGALPQMCYRLGLKPSELRMALCEQLFLVPDRSNWSEFPNVDAEVHEILSQCRWFEVYDFIENVSEKLRKWRRISSDGSPLADEFDGLVSRFFRTHGYGWTVSGGRVEFRGSEMFEHAVRQGRDELLRAGKQTAAAELHEALNDLSRRPIPEITGAIQHAMAALECVAREKCGSKDTLGDIVRRNEIFPKPIDTIVEKAWGWTSNNGRHLLEGKSPSFEEAELMVGISGVLCLYLQRKI